jgi:hypothetical protein
VVTEPFSFGHHSYWLRVLYLGVCAECLEDRLDSCG